MHHVERVFRSNDGLCLDGDAVLLDVRPAEVIRKRCAQIRIMRRAAVRVVLVTNEKQSHERFTFVEGVLPFIRPSRK